MPVEIVSGAVGSGAEGLVQQHRESVDRAGERVLEGRDRGLRAGHVRLGLRQVEARGRACLVAVANQPQGAALAGDVAARDRQPALVEAHLDVGLGDVRVQAHEHRAVLLEDAAVVGPRGLDRAAHVAEQVELPGRREAHVVQRGLVRGEARERLARPGAQGLRGPVEVGDAARRGDPVERAGLVDAREGDAQVEVAGGGALDQRAEHGVVELAPPGPGLDRLVRPASRAGRGLPVVGQLGRGRLVVGADQAAAGEPGEGQRQEAPRDRSSPSRHARQPSANGAPDRHRAGAVSGVGPGQAGVSPGAARAGSSGLRSRPRPGR